MGTGQLNGLIRQIHRLAGLQDVGQSSDGQLLERFLMERDEAAFEGLLLRHGPMVLGVCQRVLHRSQDVEDAFQATFLVLVKKAPSIRPREMVGNWLYGVAYRTALKARAMAAKRILKEKQVDQMTGPSRIGDVWQEVQAVLDEELERLPDKYRAALVLCDLEGKSRKEVAGQLKLPEGTLSSRLATARKMLARRLTRRGITLSAGALATLVSQNVAAASVPTALLASTLKAASLAAVGPMAAAGVISTKVAALTQGVLHAMSMTKLKLAMVVFLTLGLLGSGIGMFVGHHALGQQPEKKDDTPKAQDKQPSKKNETKQKQPSKAEKKADPFLGLKDRLKKHEDEIAKLRQAMLKEIEDEGKKLDEAIKKAQDAFKAGDRDSFQKAARLRSDKMRLTILRHDVERRINVGDDKAKAAALPLEQQIGMHATSPSSTLRQQLGLAKDQGLIVDKVTADSAAAKAGLKVHDILLKIKGQKVPSDVNGLRKLLKEIKGGTAVDVTVLRQGKEETIQGLMIPAVSSSETQLSTPNPKPIEEENDP